MSIGVASVICFALGCIIGQLNAILRELRKR